MCHALDVLCCLLLARRDYGVLSGVVLCVVFVFVDIACCVLRYVCCLLFGLFLRVVCVGHRCVLCVGVLVVVC